VFISLQELYIKEATAEAAKTTIKTITEITVKAAAEAAYKNIL
jgi:hypothetical protein